MHFCCGVDRALMIGHHLSISAYFKSAKCLWRLLFAPHVFVETEVVDALRRSVRLMSRAIARPDHSQRSNDKLRLSSSRGASRRLLRGAGGPNSSAVS
jgi:hypothetical protein